MNNSHPIRLGLNIDHIATIRQARLTPYPDLLEAALLAERSGADSITMHLREDRRHIQDADVDQLRDALTTPLNLEMAATDEMIQIASKIKPTDCCLVPEKREELTTEGGLDVCAEVARITEVNAALVQHHINVSLFVDADYRQIDAALETKAPIIELHTGHYANNPTPAMLNRLITAAQYARRLGLQVNAGHGLHLNNVSKIAAIKEIVALNIGHAIIARALFVGLAQAITEIKQVMITARL